MSEPDSTSPTARPAIEAAAAGWLALRVEGFTPGQAAAFTQWCNARPEHAAAIARLEAAGDRFGRVPLQRGDPRVAPGAGSATAAAKHAVQRFPLRWAAVMSLAACLALVAGVWALWGDRTTSTDRYATGTGEARRFVLADHSVLRLNGATEVRVRLSRDVRRILLARGEAHFAVARDSARPFIVEAGGVAVRATGTAFNLRLARDLLEVLVTEGKVQVDAADGAPPLRVAGAVVLAGQRAAVATGGDAAGKVDVQTIDDAVFRRALAWQTPRLQFSDTPLFQVVEQFNRYNEVRLEITDPELSSRPVGGAFQADQVESFVRLLEQSGDVLVERPSPELILLRKAGPPP